MGYGETDRVLITHIDDMGFCHAANAASLKCLTSGSASCASIIVNSPWVREAVSIVKDHPDLDIGVHLTLTSEYPNFRWPALSSRDVATGLVDPEGYLWHTRADAVRHVLADAAEAEMRSQIETALEAGIKVTHIDTHMGSVVHPKFLMSYLSLGQEFGLVPFLPNITKERLTAMNMGEMADEYLRYGNLFICRITDMPSILTESAYMIFPEQEKRLLDPTYRKKIAQTIIAGLRDYLEYFKKNIQSKRWREKMAVAQ